MNNIYLPNDVDFYHTIAIPVTVIWSIVTLCDIINHLPDLSEGVTDNLPGDFYNIHMHLTDTINYIIRFSERILSLYPSDPDITITHLIARHNNMVIMHNNVGNLFHQVQSAISNVERATTLNDDPLLLGILDSLNHSGTRLRLAHNTLITVLRITEGAIHFHYPAFVRLPIQWFE